MSTYEAMTAWQPQQHDFSQATSEDCSDVWSFPGTTNLQAGLAANRNQQTATRPQPSRDYQQHTCPIAPPQPLNQIPVQCWASACCTKVGTADEPCDALGTLQDGGNMSSPIEEIPPMLEKQMTDAKPYAPAPKEPKGRHRLPHNLVERRYRNHLNGQIDALRLVVPSVREDVDEADVEDSSVPLRPPSKADIICAGTAHIKALESEKARMLRHNAKLQEQVAGLQKLVKCDDCSILQYLSSLQLNITPDERPQA